MVLKNIVKLGDILQFNTGELYFYVICPEVGEDSNHKVLVNSNGYLYYGSGLKTFNDNLCNKITNVRTIKIYRPFCPITHISYRGKLGTINLKKYLERTRIIYPINKNFINISLYV